MNLEEFATQLLAHMGIDSATVTATETNETYDVEISVGEEESGLLIGRHAETLDSLQHILRLLFQKDITKAIMVNINDFRQQRVEYLKTLARRIADRVIETGRPQTLHLPASERRIVHMELQNDEQVTTQSEGESYNRVLKVMLKEV